MGKRKVRVGQVVSDKMDKTIVVAIESFRPHPLYKKNIRKVKRYKVHDEDNTCRIGDKVKIMETRPLSKEKRWRVAEIMSRGLGSASLEANKVQFLSPTEEEGEKDTQPSPSPLSGEESGEPTTLREDDSELQ